MKKFGYLFISLLLLLPSIVKGVSITASGIKVEQGGTGTIYVKASGNKKIAGGQFDVASSDTGKVTITSVKGAGIFTNYGNKSTAIIYNSENKAVASPTNIATITVKVGSGVAVGSIIKINITNSIVSLEADYATYNATSISPTVTVTEKKVAPVVVEKSSDATLKTLTVKEYNINFNKTNDNYIVVVNNEITKLNIETVTNHSKATVKMTGNENLVEGENTVNVVVTSEKGTTKTYQLMVYRLKKGETCENKIVEKENNRDEKIWVYISYGLLVVIIAETTYIVASDNHNNEERKTRRNKKRKK